MVGVDCLCKEFIPVPDYNLRNQLGEFHYCMPDQVKNHTFQEKFSLTKEKVPMTTVLEHNLKRCFLAVVSLAGRKI